MEECPEGYPRLAAFLDSDDCFMIYRRFGFLHSRLLLWKQNELEEVEQALDELDRADARGSKVRERCLRSREHDQTRTDMNGKESRAQLLQRGEALIREYGMQLCFFVFTYCFLLQPLSRLSIASICCVSLFSNF